MADVRGTDKAPRTQYKKTGISRVNGGQNPDYYKLYYEANKEKILARNKELRQLRKEKGIKNRITPQTWRFMVISLLRQRDGDKCAVCGEELDFNNLKSMHIDHKVPYWYSQDDTAENLQLAHSSCNLTRSRKYGN
jgi:CRISPR/Cas system Type II protein with McrA/HNH and RuvC-like nuclease domain